MRDESNDGYVVVETEEDADLGFFPVDDIDFSNDTEWFFEGAWLSFISMVDTDYPSVTIGDPMCREYDDGGLGVWARLDFGISVMWLKVMTFAPFHWVWRDEEYH